MQILYIYKKNISFFFFLQIKIVSSEKKMHKQQTQSISTFTYVLKQNNTDLQFGDAYQESGSSLPKEPNYRYGST